MGLRSSRGRNYLIEVVSIQGRGFKYSLYSFEIRRDVNSGRLRTLLRVTIKRVCFAGIPYTMRAFHGTSPEIRNLPEVTPRSGLELQILRGTHFQGHSRRAPKATILKNTVKV